ncbi:hypothetical protein [Piscinibacter sp. XHJ-5]|uniref:hypothetical protein n=1 Tax=Piscinibacter sp. XHJ-5 TaxID=3037797 RepID=UPI00245371E4|nr:hypothetical protein [Piscinibacter sp. XHJ-5]
MRASPAFQVSIVRFGVWRAAVAASTLLALSSLAAWWLAVDEVPTTMVALPLALVSLAAIGVGASLLRCTPTSLRWDTQRWHFGPAGAPGEEPTSGNLAIALDLGAWMLLKFESDQRRTTWLPVQRRGLEAHWHALRCAVYCARPASGPVAGQNSAISTESQE